MKNPEIKGVPAPGEPRPKKTVSPETIRKIGKVATDGARKR